MESDVAVLKKDVAELKADVKTLKDDVATLKGGDIERRVRDSILNIAKDTMNLTRGRMLHSGSGDMDAQLRQSIEQAEDQGRITESDAGNLLVADIIMRARRETDRQYVYAVIEVSYTVNNRDIDRARDRARTLAAATGEETVAAVVGGVVRPQQRQYASATGVQVAIPAIFGVEQPAGENHD